MNDARLIVNGTAYLGWTSIEVVRSFGQLAPTFAVDYAELWSGQNQGVPIREGDACVVELEGSTVITGYVDSVRNSYAAESHDLAVSGCGKTGDLVDCSAEHATGRGIWLGQTALVIAKDLCRPFGIGVTAQVPVGAPFSSFKLQDGETAYEALDRVSRMRGLLLATTVAGDLVFTKPSAKRTSTVIDPRSLRVVSGARDGSWKERFSKYTVKSQKPGSDGGLTSMLGIQAAVTGPKATSLDTDVTRYRPTTIQSDGSETGALLQQRADWERNARAGRSLRVTYVLEGWRCAEGLWEPNIVVRVKDPTLRVDADLVTFSVCYARGEEGSTTTLELVDPLTIAPAPLKPKRRRDEQTGMFT